MSGVIGAVGAQKIHAQQRSKRCNSQFLRLMFLLSHFAGATAVGINVRIGSARNGDREKEKWFTQVSDENFKFTPSPNSKFPKLIMRAFTSPDDFVEWVFTPPEGAGFFTYQFEAKQEGGILHINMDPKTAMIPKAPE